MADLLSGLGDTIMDGIQAILYATIYKLLYYIAVGCCWIVNLLYSMFEVMAGLSKVSYDGSYDYLINIFFSNTTVSKVYWGMALIGMAAGFAFAIAAVIKKFFDTNDKEKRSYGQILTALFKSILTILCMSLIVTMVINATTLLMQQINYVFINADDLGEEEIITYTDEEYAAMARALNTIGNFSLNPSYNNRYNLNKCFNEIRFDLQYLKNQGVFDVHYVTKDMEGNTIATWQSALRKVANAASLDRDLRLDVYHESVSNALLEAMDLLKVNGSFKPLEEYQRQYQPSRASVPMDRLLFLMASMRAAKNSDYNESPSLTDPLRGAYYYGEKSIYDLDTVNEDFDIGIAALDYMVLFLTSYKMLQILVTLILNCVSRIFNMLLLYLIAPLVVAVNPLDDGAKFKQWTTAFVVQSLSVFGTVISMRVILLFMPVVTDPKLVLFDNAVGNLLAKLVIILAGFEVVEKATSLVTGILADNAGWQSITAGDMSGTAKSVVGQGLNLANKYGVGTLKSAGGLGLSAVGFGAKTGVKAVAGAGLLAGYGVYGGAKAAIAGGKALANKISAWRNSGGNAGGGETPNANSMGGNGEGGGGMLPENQHDAPVGDNSGAPVNTDSSLAPQTDVGTFQDRVKALEARMNPPEGGAQNTGPTQPLPQGISPGIQSRVEALDAHMNRSNQHNPTQQGSQPGAPAEQTGGQPDANAQYAPQTNVGTFQDRAKALEARMNPPEGGAQNTGSTPPLPQGISPGIQSRVEALDAHMNRTNQNNQAQQGSQPGAPAEQTGGQPGANAQYAPQTNVGTFQDRAKALEAWMNPVAGGATNTGPTQPLPQGSQPGAPAEQTGGQPGANAQYAPQTNVGTFQDRAKALEAWMNPVAGGATNTGPTQPLPQGISPGIQSRVEAPDAHMNRTNQNNQAPQAAQPGANVPQTNVGTFQDRLAAAAAHMNGQVVPRKAPPDSVRNRQNNP